MEKVEAEVKIEAVGGEEVKVEKTEEVTVQVETATGDGGEVTSEVQVTSEEVTSEVQVTSEEGGGEVQVTSEVATEEQKEDQPPAAEGKVIALSLSLAAVMFYFLFRCYKGRVSFFLWTF